MPALFQKLQMCLCSANVNTANKKQTLKKANKGLKFDLDITRGLKRDYKETASKFIKSKYKVGKCNSQFWAKLGHLS